MLTPTFRPPRSKFLTLLFLTLLLTGACAEKTGPSGTSQTRQPDLIRERVVGTRGGALSYRVATPPKTFNPLMVADEVSYAVSFMLLNSRLIDFDHDTHRYAPALAESWSMDETGRVMELTLRDNLRFSDGHPLTTDDVIFTFRAIYDERAASVFSSLLIIGGKQINLTKLDERRLRLVFPEMVAAPENYLINVVVLPHHVLEKYLSDGNFGSDAYSVMSEPARIVTAGAFTVESAELGRRVTLKPNPHYWKKDSAGNALPYLDKLFIEVIEDANVAVVRLDNASLDIIDRIRPNDYVSLSNSQGRARAYDLGPALATDQMWFNLNETGADSRRDKQEWFRDARFRRAVSHAIDREGISSTILRGFATPLYGFISPGNRSWVANDLTRHEYDLNRARALLVEAGFVLRGTTAAPELFDARGQRVGFTLLVPASSEERIAMAAVIQEDLARLGIRVEIASLDVVEVVRRTSQSFDYDAVLLGTVVGDIDPNAYFGFLLSSSANHQWHPKQQRPATEWEARIDGLVSALSREREVEKRRAYFREIQQILVEQSPVIPVVARHVMTATSRNIGNYRPSYIPPYSLWNAEELFLRQ